MQFARLGLSISPVCKLQYPLVYTLAGCLSCPPQACFAGLGFLSWYLAGKIKAFDRGGHVAKLCIVLLPLLLATMVAVSRVSDYWHHWQDVFAGGVLGRYPSQLLSSAAPHPTIFLKITHQLTIYAWYNSAGLVVASFCYLQFFPPPYSKHGMMLSCICQNSKFSSIL